MEEKKELQNQDERVVEIELERLRGFVNHPFKVQADSQMIELQESIKKYGILNPLIVRPRQDGTYEIISGHRRKFAAEKIGYRKVPVIIRVLKDDEAVVSMVDSNLQREMISPSEKAFAYKMKYEAIKRKAGRRKCGQVDHNLGKKSIELIGEECGDSPKQVQRYIKITELIPEMLEKVDDGSMGFTPAVQLSFLKKKEQKEMLDAMEFAQCTPSLSQALRIKKLSSDGNLTVRDEWYVRDSSRKIKSVLRAKGMSGIHTNSIGIYGYKKDPNDKNHWIVDDEAAEVVRRIYRMAIEGKGPYEIARILASEKVERPSYYLAQRGLGKHKTSYNPDEPYTWRGGTVADILSKPEYIGHTVNFRIYKESYKDKHSKMTPKEDLVIFENTQEAIIDKETWERVQTLRKTIRRTDTIGTANPLTGLMFCADCGAKMYNHRGKAGNARDWAGRPTGKKRPDRDEYNCSRYDLGNQHFDDYCTTHLIRTAVVNELLLEAIKEVCDYAQNNEAEFMAQVCSASEDRQAKAAKAIRQRKQRSEKRTDELSRLIRKLYEDNVNGRLSDKLFEQMLHDFEAELEGLTDSITQDQQELDRISRETVNAEKFLALVKKYTDFSELTPAMINEFVEKILVHQAEGKGASRTQEVEIFFNFIGKVEIPRKEIELTEEEKAALAEQERRRAKKAEYNRRYMEKKRRQWKEQQEREKEQQEALELPAASTEKGERIA